MNPQVDDLPEIIVGGYGTGSAGVIYFYRGDGSNNNNPFVLNVPSNFDIYPVPGPTVGDIDNDGIPELLMTCFDRRIRVFRNYMENATAPMSLWFTSSGQTDEIDQRPYLADFDQDGTPEVYAGNDIFKFDFSNPAMPALNKVINGNSYSGQAHYDNSSQGATNSTAVDILTPAECNGDPDANGLELVAGPVIYSVDLDLNDGDGYQLKVQRDLNNMVPAINEYFDGYTAVADVNIDGTLDIIVTSRRTPNRTGVYVWNKNGLIRFMSYPGGGFIINSGSLACIANVYDDRQAGFAQDFPEILICSSFNFTCYNLNAAQSNPTMPYWWNLPTTDFSGWTGSTVYDFNGDGISEIVYRDEQNFRILYGGPAPFPTGVDAERNWYKSPCFSGTSDEYAVVADVDNDGETEIAVTGRNTQSFSNNRGRLSVFESAPGPWVPSRNLWNQYNYFIVNVNDDLSIPAVQKTHHLELPAPGSGKRPLNYYLSQTPVYDEDYEISIPLPDASCQATPIQCFPDSLLVEINICNTGDQTLHSGIPIAFYRADPTLIATTLLGTVRFTNAEVPKDSCVTFRFTIPKITGTTFGVLNDNGTQPSPFQLDSTFSATSSLECNWLNNLFQFESFPPPNLPVLGPDISTCQDTTVNLSPGTGYASYLWQDGSSGSDFLALMPGQYWVETTDFCFLKQRDTVVISLAEMATLQIDTTNGDCFGTPATVSVTAITNFHPVVFQWSTGDTAPSLSGLPDGMYTVSVTNSRGCRSVDSTWVEAGGNLQAVAAISTPILCFGDSGTIDLEVLIGKAPFTYSWSNGYTTPTIDNALAGNYQVTITDADMCVQALNISISEPLPLLSSGISVQAACPGISNGEAFFLGAIQGTAPYTLLWSTAASTDSIGNLIPGNYQLSVTDANGCQILEDFSVPEWEAPAATSNIANISCNGKNDGAISINIAGGSPGFGYQWSNGTQLPTISNLTAGPYQLTLTFADGRCAQTFDFQINEPAPIIPTAVSSPAACNGGSNGAIDISVQNGVAPLSYFWSNNQISEDLSNIQAGAYSLTITDANGCSKTISETVPELPSISSSFIETTPQCAGQNNGSIALTLGNGTPPFLVSWSNGGTGLIASNLSAGQYSATITDFADCTEVIDFQLNEPAPLQSAGISASAACPGEANGEATFLGASQGTPPYSHVWFNNSTAPTLTNLSAGNYSLVITDAKGCTLSENIQITEWLAPTVNATTNNASCFGANNGSISLSVSNGSPGYGFVWSNNATAASITNLAPGPYAVTVSFADGKCSETIDFQILEPTQLIIADSQLTQVKCNGALNGAVAISTSGGTSPYSFSWSSGQSSEDINNVAAGQYLLSISDANGCALQSTFLITQPEPLISTVSIAADTCESGNGAIEMGTAGGTSPYQLLWSNGATSASIANLETGSYQITITDANQCSLTREIGVPAWGTVPSLTALGGTITCASPAIQIEAGSNQNNLQYFWQAPVGTLPNQASHWVSAAGNYTLTVTNAFGCTAQTSLLVQLNIQTPTADAGQASIHLPCTENSYQLDASGSSQGAFYLNNWSFVENGNSLFDTTSILLNISNPGLYIHTVTNTDNGCLAKDSVLVDWDEPIAALLSVDEIKCFGDDNGTIHIQGLSGGTPPFEYSIDNQHFSETQTYSNLAPGNYTVWVQDDFGCSWDSLIVLSEPSELSVELTSNSQSIQLGQTVHLEATPSPSNATLIEINWAPTTFVYSLMSLQQSLKPDTSLEFSVQIVDENGCIAEDRLLIAVHNHHIYVPNVIFPGSNDNGGFTIFGGDGLLKIQLLRVYDRWGELLFERKNFDPNQQELGWDGSYNGQPLNPGVFAWYGELLMQDGQVLFVKGDVTIIR